MDGGVSYPQFAMVTLLRLAACSVPASQFSMVAPHRSQAHSRLSLLHWAHRRLLQPLAAPPLSPSLDFRFACFRHWRRRSFVPTGLTSRCFAHWARASCFPQFGIVVSLRSQSSLGILLASLGLLRAVSPTGRALRAPQNGLTLLLRNAQLGRRQAGK